MTETSARTELKSERIDLEKHALARWSSADDGRTLLLSHQFRDRATAMAFLAVAAALAAQAKTCPKIEHILGKIRLSLTTYELGALTSLDYRMAEVLEKILDYLEGEEVAE